MTRWATVSADIVLSYSPVGLRLIDELTGSPPIGNVQATLDILDANGSWRQTDIAGVRTASDVVTYPGLERHTDPTGQQPRQYRVRLAADFYLPYYRASADGIPFTAYPFSNTDPPATVVQTASDTLLLPAPNYPFASHVRVLRGRVVDAANNPVPDAYVTQSNSERALTDSQGSFALPLRWLAANAQASVDAVDERTGRTGSIQIHLPSSLGQSQTIAIS